MYHKIVLICLIIANVLNLFASRYGTDNDRGLIYIANGVSLVVMTFFLLVKPLKFPKCYRPLKWFLALFIAMLIIQFYSPNNYFAFNMYIKWLVNLLLIFFFYSFEQSKPNDRLMQIYIITFIAECCLKVYHGSAFSSVENLTQKVGGDTASMGLALVVPLIFLFFRNKKGLLLYVVCSVFCLFSLRRSSILAMLIVVPFIWPILKQNVNKKYLVLGFVIAFIFIFRAWDYVGAKVIRRFFENHSSLEEMESYGVSSYGSGRTEFWGFLYDKFLEYENYLFGNGMGSIRETCITYYRLSLPHAHNDIFEIGFTFGIVGLFFWFAFIIKSSIAIIWATVSKVHKKNFVCAILVYLFVGITSGAIIKPEMYPMAIAIPILLQPLRTTEAAIDNNKVRLVTA